MTLLNASALNATNLILIDAAVTDYQTLTKGVAPTTEVVILDATHDGLDQITSALTEYSRLSTIHIVSHGSSGQLQLGSTSLHLNNLEFYAEQIRRWADVLSGADILLYGCQVALGEVGDRFIQYLADLTQANIAASTTTVGSAALGGNWQLDKWIGRVTSSPAFAPAALEAYPGVLASTVISNLLYSVSDTQILTVNIETGESEVVGELAFSAYGAARQSSTGLIYYVERGSNGRVATWNPTTGENVVLPSMTGIDSILKLTQAPDNASAPGLLYALNTSDTFLYTINPTTGAASAAGQITGGNPPFTAGSGDAAFDPTNPNRMFVSVVNQSQNSNLPDTYRIYTVDVDPNSPTFLQATFVGDAGLDYPDAGSMAFGQDGQLYATSNGSLYRLDKNTAAPTFIGELGFEPNDFASLPTPTPEIDLAITKSDGLEVITPGEPITYTITVSNPSDFNIPTVNVVDQLPDALINVSWTAVITGGGSFINPVDPTNPASQTGNGDINTTLSLDAGATVTYTIQATVSPTAPIGGELLNQVSVTTPGIIDPNEDNNDITDITVIVSPDNLLPNATDVSLLVPANTPLNVTGLSATDPDGTIASYIITSLPVADQGTLFLGNPATGGVAITVGQVLTPEQIGQVFFNPTATFTGAVFNYTAKDDQGAPDPTPAIVTLSPQTPVNQPPNVLDVTLPVPPGINTLVTGLTGTDADGAIVSYTVATLPTPNQGTLYLGDPATGGVPIVPGQVLTPDQLGQVIFQPGANFTGASFTYTATDNQGAVDPTPGNVVLTVGTTPTPLPNQPPSTNDATVSITPGTTVNVPGLTATDPDGDIAGYTIVTIPTPDQGTLYLGDPNAGGVPITPGQEFTPEQISQIFFQPGPNFNGTTFTYTSTDDQGSTDPTPATITLIPGGNNPPPPVPAPFPPVSLDECQPGVSVRGNPRNNSLRGTRNADFIVGRAGDDELRGLECSDTISGGRGNDRIFGNQASDILYGKQNRDRIRGGLGNDTMRGGLGFDDLRGGPGDDFGKGNRGRDTLGGGRGNDTLDSGMNSDRLYGGRGDDYLRGRQDADTIGGGHGDDTINGGLGNDEVRGRPDNDVIRGRRGDDKLVGGRGDDQVDGGFGSDRVMGNRGNDFIRGRQDNDFINGGFGSDTLIGGLGRDTLRGKSGDDLIDGKRGRDHIVGGAGDDLILGGLNNDTLRGSRGHDRIDGGLDDDRITGGRGSDSLIGGLGSDTLKGGRGKDFFIYNRIREGGDVILDFEQRDRINLSRIFNKPKFSDQDNPFARYIRLEQIGSAMAVQIDSNGDAAGLRLKTLATLEGVATSSIGASQFLF
jgi:uncharacterized repeat protein (TIGR01451 family)